MAMPHAVSGEVIDVRPLGARLPQAPSVALFKSQDLEVLRLVLLRGKSLPAHQLEGHVTLQCLEGRVEVLVHDQPRNLQPGEMIHIAAGTPRSVRALENASLLMSIALHGGATH